MSERPPRKPVTTIGGTPTNAYPLQPTPAKWRRPEPETSFPEPPPPSAPRRPSADPVLAEARGANEKAAQILDLMTGGEGTDDEPDPIEEIKQTLRSLVTWCAQTTERLNRLEAKVDAALGT